VRFPTVIFQITAIGRNTKALEASARSVMYWVRHTPGLAYVHRLWIVVEPEGYGADPAMYEALRAEGAEVWVVPRKYSTPLGTTGKARALQFAVELRLQKGWSGASTWIYHQDEETCVGQDTLLGISDFIREGPGLVGVGIILYPLDWSGSPSHIQELTRSYDDFRVLDSMTLPRNPTLGFHGSHILVRSDVEDSIGWDSVGYAPAEDLTFEIRVRSKYGSVFRVLKGFAYEKGAFSLSDQLRQRRRWVHGVLFALTRSPELSRVRRATLLYSLFAWFSALPSVILLIASVEFHYGPILVFTGVFTGFVWVSMVTGYIEGFRLHSNYVQRTVSIPRFIIHGFIGALVDVIAPWYALLTRPSRGDFIAKDRPVLTSSS
jgi:beta-1,4-mannosyltransferase